MGVLNCQKCFNSDNMIKNELITGNNLLKNQKVLLALDSLRTTLSPRNSSENFSQNKNNSTLNKTDHDHPIKEKNKRLINASNLQLKSDEDFINDLEYNTLEIIYNDSFSGTNEINSENKKDNESEENYKIRLKYVEELFGCDEDSSSKNNSFNDQNFINNYKNNLKKNDKIEKNMINCNCDLNNLINEKIKEKNQFEIQNNKKEKDLNENNLDKNCYNNKNSNYIYLHKNNFNDIGSNNNYINQLIVEENEEYEQEKEYKNKSFINNKYKLFTFNKNDSEGEENIELKKILNNKNLTKSEKIKNKNKNEETIEISNYDDISYKIETKEEKSIISYELDENININNNDNNFIEEIENEKINIKEEKDLFQNNENNIKRLNFINIIEQKLNNNIYKSKIQNNKYIITDAFCDYEP